MSNFVLLLQELRAAFDEEAIQTGQPKLLLTAAVAAGKDTINKAYEIPQISQLVLYIQNSINFYFIHFSM